ncbi:MAG: DUF3299 domain-containing protein [Planctomycetales bacterium]|nr:DUF3299 domain-containing protein [Planctomycetales bacterium]
MTLLCAAGCDRLTSAQPSPVSSAATEQHAAPAPSQPATEPATQPEPTDDRLANKTFDDLKFDIEPDAPFYREMLTEGVESLDGRRIKIRGYIFPTPQRHGLKEFVLVRDNMECCFGPGAALYDCILIEMQPGRTASFSVRPVSVTGRFRVEEFPGPEGRPLAVFRIAGEAVE